MKAINMYINNLLEFHLGRDDRIKMWGKDVARLREVTSGWYDEMLDHVKQTGIRKVYEELDIPSYDRLTPHKFSKPKDVNIEENVAKFILEVKVLKPHIKTFTLEVALKIPYYRNGYDIKVKGGSATKYQHKDEKPQEFIDGPY